MVMRKPAYLVNGDTVALVSTARKTNADYIDSAKKILESWGLRVVLGSTIGASHNQYAGTDSERIQDMQYLLDRTDIKAIINARGGYGTVRVIDHLSFENFVSNPKWICGFSDVTVLHNHINTNFGIQTLHCTMPISFETTSPHSVETMKRSLFGQLSNYNLKPHALNRLGQGSGILLGGNLSIIYSLKASASQIDTDGAILFLEDLDEYLYHVDRMVMGLKRAGQLHKINGLLIGGMSDMNDNTIPFGTAAEEIIKEHTREFNYPIAFGIPAGHIHENWALYMGRQTSLDVRGDGTTLTF